MKVIRLLCVGLVLQVGSWASAATPTAVSEASTAAIPGSAAPEGELNDAQKFAPALLAANRNNSERLQGVELVLSRTLINAGLKEEVKDEQNLPDGGKVISRKLPQQTFAERVVVLEDRVRVDQGGVGTSPKVTYWYDGVRWTEANTSARRVARMHTHQMGGRMLDPREAAGIDPRTSLANILSAASLKDATVSMTDSVSTLTTTTNPGGQKLVVEFDSNFGLLPTRSRLFHLNGALAREAVMTYSKIVDRDAWALQGITEKVYDESVDGLEKPEQWKQQLITSVTCNVLSRETAEALLSPQVPEGFREIDYTDESTMRRKAPAPATRVVHADFSLKWFILAHVFVFAAVAAMYVWRRRRTSPV